MTKQHKQIRPYPLLTHQEGEGICFSFVSAKRDCGVILFDKETGRELDKIPFPERCRKGNVHFLTIKKYRPEEITYLFYEEDTIVPDINAALLGKGAGYGKERKEEDLKAGFVTKAFDWQDDKNPRVPYNESIGYLLHVRGFTKHASSQVANRGTFRGIIEKLDYLQEIGITTVELQPAYEFLEIPSGKERMEAMPYPVKEEDLDAVMPAKLNYWGYKRGFYYAPKAAYASGEPDIEFKEMVRAFHKRGMEIIMQFYFPKEVSTWEIFDILRYWILEYHVDGFHLMGDNLPADIFTEDPILSDSKIWYYYFNRENPNLASYQDDYLYAMRKFLKGDEDMMTAVLSQMRHIPPCGGRIHYLSNYYGMTLADMVSYDRKHNEENGEENRDGNDYNCSWNCGEEGATRKKKVTTLRNKMMKNALCMLLFSQSTPLIFMGDEFGNSQKGNNNPYCQDNSTTWLNWQNVKRNEKLHEFWKMLIALRKNHPVLHSEREPKIMDYIACGYPDLSYHGENAWRPQTESYIRSIGMMYCGKYGKIDRVKDDDFFYIGMNMHWESHQLGLPRLPKGLKWELLFSTEEDDKTVKQDALVSSDKELQAEADVICTVAPRSVSLFHSVADAEYCTEEKKGKRRNCRNRKADVVSADGTIADRTIF